MMVVEVRAVILHDSQSGHTRLRHRRNIRSRTEGHTLNEAGAKTLQDLLHRVQKFHGLRADLHIETEWMGRTQIAFNRRDVVCELRSMRGCVSRASTPAAFFIHPRDHAKSAFRAV